MLASTPLASLTRSNPLSKQNIGRPRKGTAFLLHMIIQESCALACNRGLRFSAITVKEVFLDWAFTFMSTYLYYEDRDILDENGLNLYRKSLACFEGNAPTYHLALREHPVIVWDFHSLMLTVKIMFSVKLTDAKKSMSLCEHCRMAFYAPRADPRFCSAECRKKASKKT